MKIKLSNISPAILSIPIMLIIMVPGSMAAFYMTGNNDWLFRGGFFGVFVWLASSAFLVSVYFSHINKSTLKSRVALLIMMALTMFAASLFLISLASKIQ